MESLNKPISQDLFSVRISIKIMILTIGFVFQLNLAATGEQIDLKSYEGKNFRIRRIINHSRVFYPDPPLDTSAVFAQLEDPRLFLYRKDRIVEIKKIRANKDNNEIVLKFDSDVTGDQDIKFISPNDKPIPQEIFENLFNRIFTNASDSSNYAYYMIDDVRKKIHVRGANHIPPLSAPATLDDIQKLNNYTFCGACFKDSSTIPSLDIELSLAQSIAAEYRKYNQVVIIDSLQAYVDSIGKSVLASWPLPLKGYRYSFAVVDNNNPNCMALPAGTIFIHSGLLDLIGDRREFEAVLAHEIAHVEWRHGLRQLLKAERTKLIGSILSIAAGIVVGLSTDDTDAANLTIAISSLIAEVSSEVAIAGYSRDMESEADELSCLYMYTKYGAEATVFLEHMLNKLKYYDGYVEESFDPKAFSSHPNVISRAKSIKDMRFEYYARPLTYIGTDSLNREVAQIQIFYITDSPFKKYVGRATGFEQRYRTSAYASIECTEFLYDVRELKDFDLWIKGKSEHFDNKEDTPLAPLTKVGCVFVSDNKYRIDLDDFGYFYMALKPIRFWTKLEND